MRKKVVLSAGGTGGHLFPAQAVAEMLKDCDVLFIAGGLSRSPYFDRARFPFQEISCATFSFSRLSQLFSATKKIWKGFRQSRRLLRSCSPDAVVGFGSFFTLPLLMAAAWQGVPIILHEQNTIPGKVNRLFSRFARITAVTFPASMQYIKKGAVQVSFPLRKEVMYENAWEYFGLSPQLPILLIFGGSQGAIRLNELFIGSAKNLYGWQILHFTGNETQAKEAQQCYDSLNIPCCVKSFEPHMQRALQITRLAVVRGGAGTIAELIEWDVPAIVVPFPFATDNHQEKNGHYFVKQVNGGEIYLEAELTSEKLAKHIGRINIDQKKQNIQNYKQTRNLPTLSEIINGIINYE